MSLDLAVLQSFSSEYCGRYVAQRRSIGRTGMKFPDDGSGIVHADKIAAIFMHPRTIRAACKTASTRSAISGDGRAPRLWPVGLAGRGELTAYGRTNLLPSLPVRGSGTHSLRMGCRPLSDDAGAPDVVSPG